MVRIPVIRPALVVIMLAIMLSGCGGTPQPSSDEKPSEQYAESSELYEIQPVSDVTVEPGIRAYLPEPVLSPESEYLPVVFENPTLAQLIYGEGFHLECYTDGEWAYFPFREEIGFPAIGYFLCDHDVREKNYNLAIFEHPLQAGHYRIVVEGMLDEETPAPKKEYEDICLEFLVRRDGAKLIASDMDPAAQEKKRAQMRRDRMPDRKEEWQWYTNWDGITVIQNEGNQTTGSVQTEDKSCIAYLVAEGNDTYDQSDLSLVLFDRRDGHFYEPFPDLPFCHADVYPLEDGFVVHVEEGWLCIHMNDGQLGKSEATEEMVRHAKSSLLREYAEEIPLQMQFPDSLTVSIAKKIIREGVTEDLPVTFNNMAGMTVCLPEHYLLERADDPMEEMEMVTAIDLEPMTCLKGETKEIQIPVTELPIGYYRITFGEMYSEKMYTTYTGGDQKVEIDKKLIGTPIFEFIVVE